LGNWAIVLEQVVKGTADRALKRGIKSRLIAAIQTTKRMTPVGVSLSNDVVRQLIVRDEHAAILRRCFEGAASGDMTYSKALTHDNPSYV